ncbi:response regulator receiver domain protein [Candidatus Moduliflexus flocculans]|uniref:histidine kinase n=1 Tax=Candidatus Moduliflexus flocculans TaxID=1499966 RepID=A0A0S6W552_9BACT|nr:response regulator receiver domain protein [Candidatus Moduliflexus flocculans]
MTQGEQKDFADFSMMDLFRTELETHLATLNDGLLALEQTPTAMDKLEALMRAVHSIKGGARIVDLDQVVRLSHVMEDCFVAAQRHQLTLQSPHIDLLFRGADLIREISDATAEADEEWFQTHHRDIEQTIKAVAAILLIGTAAVTSPQTSPPASTPAETLPSVSEQPEQALPEPPVSSQIAEPAENAPSSGGDPDGAMREFFRSEVEVHTAMIGKIFDALQNGADPAEKLDGMLQTLQAIKGGAQIVGIQRAVAVAEAMAMYVQASRKRQQTPPAGHLATLNEGLGALREIAKTSSQNQELSRTAEEQLDRVLRQLEELAQDASEMSLPRAQQTTSIVYHEEEAVPLAGQPPLTEDETEEASEVQIYAPALEGKSDNKKGESKDRTVRVTATKIERLMGLAGEVVVSARWLPSYSESLLTLKKTHRELFALLEKLRELTRNEQQNEMVRNLVLSAREKAKEANATLAVRLNQLEMFNSTSATLSDRLYHEVIGIRMRPFSDGIRGFPRMVRDLAREIGKKVQLDIIGKATEVDRDILEKLDAPLTHLLRNAVDHGLEFPDERLAAGKPEIGTVRLEASHRSGMLLITVSDDGRGIDMHKLRQKILRKGLANTDMVNHLTEPELLKFLFLPGFSTSEQVTEISGRGVGLDVVDNMVHEVGGVVRVTSRPGKGVSFYLELPLTLSVIRTFLVEIAGEPYAFPLARIERCLLLSKEELNVVEDRQYFRFDDENVAMVNVHEVLELPKTTPNQREKLPVVVITDRSNLYGLLVDKFVGECDLVVRPLDPRLGKVPDISSVAVMLDGSPILIFDVEDLVRSVDKMLTKKRLGKLQVSGEEHGETITKRILVVDDSITVREMERKLLENKGYHVEVAVDGLAGWNAARAEEFDLIVSDVDMPRMNGIEFVRQIKQHEELKKIPVIIVSYKDTEEHRLQGLEAGADYYLTKSSFQDDSFINAVADLIGEA